MTLQARQLEQYKDDGKSYASQAEFSTFDNEGNVETKGFCGLLSADTKNKIYGLFDSVNIDITDQNIELSAGALRYEGNSQQLTGGISDTVSIKKNGTLITGKGFSASGVNHSFSFIQAVQGSITEEEQEQKLEQEEIQEDTAE